MINLNHNLSKSPKGKSTSPFFRKTEAAQKINSGQEEQDDAYYRLAKLIEESKNPFLLLSKEQEPLADIKSMARDILEMATHHSLNPQQKPPNRMKGGYNQTETINRLHEAEAKKREKIVQMQREAYLEEVNQMKEGIKISQASQKILQSKEHQPIYLRASAIIKAKQDKVNKQIEEKKKQEESLPCFTPNFDKGRQKRSVRSFLADMKDWEEKKNWNREKEVLKINNKEAEEATFKPKLNQKSQKLAVMKISRDKIISYYFYQEKKKQPEVETQNNLKKQPNQIKINNLNSKNKITKNQDFQKVVNKENILLKSIEEKEQQHLPKVEQTAIKLSYSSSSFQTLKDNTLKNDLKIENEIEEIDSLEEIVQDFACLGKISSDYESNLHSQMSLQDLVDLSKKGVFSKLHGINGANTSKSMSLNNKNTFNINYCKQNDEEKNKMKKSQSSSKLVTSSVAHCSSALNSRSVSPQSRLAKGEQRLQENDDYKFFIQKKSESKEKSIQIIRHPNLDFIISLMNKERKIH